MTAHPRHVEIEAAMHPVEILSIERTPTGWRVSGFDRTFDYTSTVELGRDLSFALKLYEENTR